MDDLLTDFLTETDESLAELDVALLRLERTPDDAETLSLIFRLVHTIKGTCGFLGLPRLERVAHAGENVLGRLRDGTLAATRGDRDAGAGGGGRCPADRRGAERDRRRAGGRRRGADRARSIRVTGATAPLPERRRRDGCQPSAARRHARRQRQPQTIRVTVDVLEDLMTLVSELVLTRNQLLQLARTQENSGFTVPLQRLSHITSDLQEGVMKTRMQPIGNAWNKLPRLVRDLVARTGQEDRARSCSAPTPSWTARCWS